MALQCADLWTCISLVMLLSECVTLAESIRDDLYFRERIIVLPRYRLESAAKVATAPQIPSVSAEWRVKVCVECIHMCGRSGV